MTRSRESCKCRIEGRGKRFLLISAAARQCRRQAAKVDSAIQINAAPRARSRKAAAPPRRRRFHEKCALQRRGGRRAAEKSRWAPHLTPWRRRGLPKAPTRRRRTSRRTGRRRHSRARRTLPGSRRRRARRRRSARRAARRAAAAGRARRGTLRGRRARGWRVGLRREEQYISSKAQLEERRQKEKGPLLVASEAGRRGIQASRTHARFSLTALGAAAAPVAPGAVNAFDVRRRQADIAAGARQRAGAARNDGVARRRRRERVGRERLRQRQGARAAGCARGEGFGAASSW